jgi:predicted negative regulator of RcsB-dependent stress response
MKNSTVLWTLLIIIVVVIAGWFIYNSYNGNAVAPTTSQTQDLNTSDNSGTGADLSGGVTTIVSSSTGATSTTVSTTTIVTP